MDERRADRHGAAGLTRLRRVMLDTARPTPDGEWVTACEADSTDLLEGPGFAAFVVDAPDGAGLASRAVGTYAPRFPSPTGDSPFHGEIHSVATATLRWLADQGYSSVRLNASPDGREGPPMQPGHLPVEFLDAQRIDFVEHPPPALSPQERGAVDRLWEEAKAHNPTAFDGPLVASLGIDLSGPGPSVVRWARMTYRHRALRKLRPAEGVPGSVFVTVLLPTEAGLAVGRGSPTTAAPGHWSLPGGSAEPPVAGLPLDMASLRRDAARELAEELGVDIAVEELRLWGLTRGTRFGSLGFHFLAPPVPSALVRRRHADLTVRETKRGDVPELDKVAFVPSAEQAARLGSGADYLQQVLSRYFSA
ncbi:NUDIX hydrolase [Streptomyces sp. NPDC002394]